MTFVRHKSDKLHPVRVLYAKEQYLEAWKLYMTIVDKISPEQGRFVEWKLRQKLTKKQKKATRHDIIDFQRGYGDFKKRKK